MTINGKKNNQENIQKSRINFWSWIFVGILLIASAILLFLFLNTQYKLDFAEAKYDATLNTIRKKNEDIHSCQTEIEVVNSRVIELNSKVDSQNSEIDSLNSKINSLNSDINSLNSKVSSLSKVKLSRIDVKNEHCGNAYIFVDGRLAAGTRAGGTTYFYLPYGSYSFQACNESYRSSCGSSVSVNAASSVFTFTVYKNSSCS